MASKKLPVLLAAFLAVAIAPTVLRSDDSLPPPPPGGDVAPPPPGMDASTPPPPPGGDVAPPPPGMDASTPPPPGGDMAPPPPGADASTPPPPGDAGVTPPPPGGDVVAPPTAPDQPMSPPPPDTTFPEEKKKESKGKAEGGQASHYTVAKHDSLWKISGKKKIYADSFQWPLLFIANRDQIKDPDIIKPGQDLKVKRNLGSDEVASAVKKAKDTPRYEPHTTAREKLPIEY